MNRKQTLRLATTAGAIAATTMLAACGGDTTAGRDTTQGADGGSMTITVGVQPFATMSPFHIALQEGLFEEEGLTVELHESGGGAPLIASMISGDVDVAYSNYVSFFQAAEKGLPIQVFSGNDVGGPGSGLYSLPGGPQGPADLAEKSIAINGLGNVQELTTRAVLGSHGLSQDSFRIVEIPPANMLAALTAGQVDAAWLGEPFITIGTAESNVQQVVGAYEGPTEGMANSGWGTTSRFASANPEALSAFKRVMEKVLTDAAASPDQSEVKAALTTFTKIPAEVAQNLVRLHFSAGTDRTKLEELQDLLLEHGLIAQPIDLDAFVADVG